MVGDIPSAAFEHHLRWGINAPNSAVSLGANYISWAAQEGDLFFKPCIAFGAGEVIQGHSKILVMTVPKVPAHGLKFAGQPSGRSGLFGFDGNRARFDGFRFGQTDGQDAILELGLGLVSLYVGGQHDAALK